MEKEILTHERVLLDYKARIQKSRKTLIGLLIFLLCVSVVVIVGSIRIIAEAGFVFRVIWYDLTIFVGDFICIAAIIDSNKNYQDIKNKRYYVVTDEVSGKQEEERYYGCMRAFSKAAEIRFRTYGAYCLNMSHNSDSSDRFAVSDVDNFFTAFNGDEFLLVINKKSHILLAYNAKLFEYHG